MTERMNVTDLREYVYGAYVRAKNGNTRCADRLNFLSTKLRE